MARRYGIRLKRTTYPGARWEAYPREWPPASDGIRNVDRGDLRADERQGPVRNQPLASMQALQNKLVRMRQNIEVGRSMLYDAAQLVDAG